MKTTKQTLQRENTVLKCPICNGEGNIPKPARVNKFLKHQLNHEKIAKALRAKSYSFREIARLMGYKNAQSIKHLVDK